MVGMGDRNKEIRVFGSVWFGLAPPLVAAGLVLASFGCGATSGGASGGASGDGPALAAEEEDRFVERRERMVTAQLLRRDITDERVLAAMRAVPRHLFVPEDRRKWSYEDSPLPIGYGQTISQPYIVALMTQLARAAPGKKALDVGTGSGYQAAVLAQIVDEVYSIEILCDLEREARARLDALGYDNVVTRCGDGYQGWPEQAPFDLIIVAAAPESVPEPLIEQLAPGGRLVIPVGKLHQELLVVEKSEEGDIRRFSEGGVRFVPMTGEAARETP